MVMNFWEAQARARSRTTLYLFLFALLTVAVGAAIEGAMHYFGGEAYDPPLPYLGLFYLVLTFAVAGVQYLLYRTYGGSYVAESVGGVLVRPNTTNFAEKQLLNIVEEVSIASGVPVPPIYIIPSRDINAFAAGLTKDNAAIAITAGALQLLNRDELQGVIAHEFGHVYNGDMKISMRLAAMVLGFFWVLYLGLRLLQMMSYTRSQDEDRRGGNPVAFAALLFVIAGALAYFVGSILKATVSREREYLADACAVQFTRNPDGIANALRKIGQVNTFKDMPKTGSAYSHMYLDDRGGLSALFATHPPLEKRIAAILGREYIPPEWLSSKQVQ